YTFGFFFFQAEDGIRDRNVTGVQTCALPISGGRHRPVGRPVGGKTFRYRRRIEYGRDDSPDGQAYRQKQKYGPTGEKSPGTDSIYVKDVPSKRYVVRAGVHFILRRGYVY